MYHENLKFMEETFFNTQNICTWCLTSDMNLVYSNCPEQDFFFTLFSVSCCPNIIQNHFSDSIMPLLINDEIGFVWTCVISNSQGSKSNLVYLLGPVFTSEITAKYLQQRCQKMHLQPDVLSRIMHYVKDTPTISPNTASCYATMLHYCINRASIKTSEIEIWYETPNEQRDSKWGDTNWHGSWISEQRLFKSIMEGRIENQGTENYGQIGNIGGGDSLRQAKNEMIVFTVLCSRAAILGGVSSEGALNLSDHFVQMIEEADSIAQIYNIGSQLQTTYVQRVRNAKANNKYSSVVQAILEYVSTHICEKIQLKEIAKHIGYTEFYISRTFKKEMGENLSDYINRKKIELAKIYLNDSPSILISDISEYLSFSSPSYFISNFKKYEGVSPSDYRNRHDKI